jgi:hypothetical protein
MEIGAPGVSLDLVLSNVQGSGPKRGIEPATIRSQKMEETFVQDQALKRFLVLGSMALNKVPHFLLSNFVSSIVQTCIFVWVYNGIKRSEFVPSDFVEVTTSLQNLKYNKTCLDRFRY